jgi:SpoVK/Ycf46/Vps4 family AAA+-type ATPase
MQVLPFCKLWSPLTVCIAMETLRVYRPRIILHGPAGMGQGYVATAVLHHLEGYHIQSLDLGTLMNDSARVSDHPCFTYSQPDTFYYKRLSRLR